MPEFGNTSNDKPIIWTVSMTRLEELFRDVTPEFDSQAVIHNLHGGYEDAVNLLNKRLARQPCDAIIAAGSNGSYIKQRIDRPVVLVEPSGFDLMQALSRARWRVDVHNKRVAVVTHQVDLPTFVEFCEGYGLDIEHRSFMTAEEARNCVAELKRRRVGAVVGTGLVTQLAEDAGMAGILLYSPDSVRRALNTALELVRALERQGPGLAPVRAARTGRGNGARYSLDQVLGESRAMQGLRQQIRQVATSNATLLIHGETGTGKELVAQAVHSASARRHQAFMAVNCGAIAESLLESELFGHEEGAFTGARRGGRPGIIEAAHNGTLFLDEIGEMPLALQTRLLRVLEEREVLRVGGTRPVAVDIRVIAASHCDLEAMMRKGDFRRDLYYRLNVLHLDLPTLAERPGDIPDLLAAFARRSNPRLQIRVGPEAGEVLCGYAWPGNLRELKNLAERMIAAYPARESLDIDVGMLETYAPELFRASGNRMVQDSPISENEQERQALEKALQATLGNRGLAARHLGISRSTLWRRMQKHGLLGEQAGDG